MQKTEKPLFKKSRRLIGGLRLTSALSDAALKDQGHPEEDDDLQGYGDDEQKPRLDHAEGEYEGNERERP